MRTPAQQAASRANGARSRSPKTRPNKPRSSIDPRSLELLTWATVLNKESRQGFRKLVHEHMLYFAPRNPIEQIAVEEICSATWRLYRLRAIERKATDLEFATQDSPDDLQCLVLASGELTGNNRPFYLSLQRHENPASRKSSDAPSPACGPCASSLKQKNFPKPPPWSTPCGSRFLPPTETRE